LNTRANAEVAGERFGKFQYLHALPWDDPEVYANITDFNHQAGQNPHANSTGQCDKRMPVPVFRILYFGRKTRLEECRHLCECHIPVYE
jgi:hypothetical protein